MDSSKMNTQEQKTNQPQQEGGIKKVVDDVKAKFEHHTATPGPVIPNEFQVQEEGTKEERLAKSEALNSDNGPKSEHHKTTGPVIPKDFQVQEEGTKEERLAKTEALNSESK